MTIQSKWKPNFQRESELVYGSTDQNHPGVNYLFNTSNEFYVGGEAENFYSESL